MGKDIGARNSRQSCCVVGCHNRYSNTDATIKFHRFPSKPWELERREKWIQAVSRKNLDGTKWTPTRSSFICSAHFVGNEKTQHPMSPSYLPTIFPKVYNVGPLSVAQENRFKRLQNRATVDNIPQSKRYRSVLTEEGTETLSTVNDPEEPEPKFKNVGTQTDFFVTPLSKVRQFSERADPFVRQLHKPIMVDKSTTSVLSNTSSGNFLHCTGFHRYSSFKNDDSAMADLTGVTLTVFSLLLNLLPDTSDRKISKENKLLIFLLKMKTGFTYSSLRVLFGIHRTTVANIFKLVLSQLCQSTMKAVFLPSRQSVFATMPKEFKVNYPNCRVIIDCSEIRVEQPKEVDSRIYMYSNYKSAFTMKFLIGITPSGMVSFISKCYGGRSSDSSITVDSQFLDLLEPGDEVMADKGFPGIKSTLEDRHVVIVMPPFLTNGTFSEQEVHETYQVASMRIHVERMIQRVKIYNILQKVTSELFPHIDNIVRMCCVLAN